MRQMIEQYNDQVGEASISPALSGNVIIQMVNESNPDIMRLPFADMGEGKIHVIKFVQEGLISEQQNLQLDSQDITKANEVAKGLINAFNDQWSIEQGSINNSKSSNWYKIAFFSK